MAKPSVNHINDTRYTRVYLEFPLHPNKPLTILFDTKFNNQVRRYSLKDVINQRALETALLIKFESARTLFVRAHYCCSLAHAGHRMYTRRAETICVWLIFRRLTKIGRNIFQEHRRYPLAAAERYTRYDRHSLGAPGLMAAALSTVARVRSGGEVELLWTLNFRRT